MRAARLRHIPAHAGGSDGRIRFHQGLGNLVFAGCFLQANRHFGDAVDRYAALVGLPKGLILNVTDGTNAHLVAIDRNGLLLATEAEIVDATRRNHICEIYLLDSAPDSTVRLEGSEALAVVEAHEMQLRPNQVLLERIDQADLIIYAPGTQHSSLFPSYLTQELGPRIVQNVGARKILVTNIQEDAEIPGISAVDIVDRALYYLRQRGTRPLPAPSLITHYLINDSESSKSTTPYVPLGSLQSLEDPRLVRIANYEHQQSGRHDAERVLEPFIDSLLESERQELRVAVLLLETDSIDKVAQTVLEATRAGIAGGRLQASFFYASDETLVPELRNALPVMVTNVRREGATDEASFREHLSDGEFEYVALFESSGMYRGEDLVNLLLLLRTGRLDAAWGSRRLFRGDVRESYRMRYRRAFFIGALSYLGSHLLSLATLVLFGRYVSDTLTGVRAVRYSLLNRVHCTLDDKSLNHHLLARVLRDRGEILETPVHFIPMSPEKAKRTGPSEGLRALGTLLAGRLWRL